MGKHGEIEYLRRIGEEGIAHAKGKPFSDPNCPFYLLEIGAIMLLLPPPPATLLDLGCGTGWTSRFLAKRGYRVTGLDISQDMLRAAAEVTEAERVDGVSFTVGDYEDMRFTGEFDCALFFDSLHHAVDEAKALAGVFKALKPGGRCVFSEPGRGHASSVAAIEAVARYQVTERDVVPVNIAKVARKVGFRRVTLYPHARHLGSIAYGEHADRTVRRLLGSGYMKGIALMAAAVILKRNSGIVVLTK